MVLLDTSPLLWTLADPDTLSTQGLLTIPDPVGWWTRAVALFRGRVLPIRATHVTALAALPDLHRDPFDRMLIAQSMAEGWPLVAKDEQIRAYPTRTIW
jgi:PIN domain nuclease of toxin-antitoxin system